MMNIQDRVRNGERQATWWCAWCYGTGHYMRVPDNDEAARQAVYVELHERRERHRCPRRPKRLSRLRHRTL